MFLGSFFQSVVGLGVGLLVAPAVALVAPDLMPALPLFLSLWAAAIAVGGEWEAVLWHVVSWSLPARLVGTALGVWLVTVFTSQQIGIAVGVMVLVAVLLTLRTLDLPLNRGTLVGAGFVSGVMGTTTSIGGPPLAILMQHREPAETRATMSVFFLVGVVLSLGGLFLVGDLDTEPLLASLVLVPVMVVGTWLARRVRDRVPREGFRQAVLALCAASAVVLLVRSVL